MQSDRQFQVLIAVLPHLREVALDLMPLAFSPTVCHSFGEAAHVLARQTFSLIFCSVQFDQNKLYDLLHLVKTKPGMPQIPFIAGIIDKHRFDIKSINRVVESLELIGVDHCIEYCGWSQPDGSHWARNQVQDALLQSVQASRPESHAAGGSPQNWHQPYWMPITRSKRLRTSK